MFNFASKMLNTLMGDMDQPQQQNSPGPPSGFNGQHQRNLGNSAAGHQDYNRPRQYGMNQAPSSSTGYGINPQQTRQQQQSVIQAKPSFYQQPATQPYNRTHQPPPMAMSAGLEPDPQSLDLSHLSVEERALIQNVMAKAKNMEEPISNTNASSQQDIQSSTDEYRQGYKNCTYPNSQSPYYGNNNVQQQQQKQHQQQLQIQQQQYQKQQQQHLQYQPCQRQQQSQQQQNSGYPDYQEHQHQKNSVPYQSSQQHQQSSPSYQSQTVSASANYAPLMAAKRQQQQQYHSYNGEHLQPSPEQLSPVSPDNETSTYFQYGGQQSSAERSGSDSSDDVSLAECLVNEINLKPMPLLDENGQVLLEDTVRMQQQQQQDLLQQQLDQHQFVDASQVYYDRSIGDVYTIHEDEDEASSPTGGDGVTSLRKRQMANTLTAISGLSGADFQKENDKLCNIKFGQDSRSQTKFNETFEHSQTKKVNQPISAGMLGQNNTYWNADDQPLSTAYVQNPYGGRNSPTDGIGVEYDSDSSVFQDDLKNTPEYERIRKLLNQPIQSYQQPKSQHRLGGSGNGSGGSSKKAMVREQKSFDGNLVNKYGSGGYRQTHWNEYGNYDRVPPPNRSVNNSQFVGNQQNMATYPDYEQPDYVVPNSSADKDCGTISGMLADFSRSIGNMNSGTNTPIVTSDKFENNNMQTFCEPHSYENSQEYQQQYQQQQQQFQQQQQQQQLQQQQQHHQQQQLQNHQQQQQQQQQPTLQQKTNFDGVTNKPLTQLRRTQSIINQNIQDPHYQMYPSEVSNPVHTNMFNTNLQGNIQLQQQTPLIFRENHQAQITQISQQKSVNQPNNGIFFDAGQNQPKSVNQPVDQLVAQRSINQPIINDNSQCQVGNQQKNIMFAVNPNDRKINNIQPFFNKQDEHSSFDQQSCNSQTYQDEPNNSINLGMCQSYQPQYTYQHVEQKPVQQPKTIYEQPIQQQLQQQHQQLLQQQQQLHQLQQLQQQQQQQQQLQQQQEQQLQQQQQQQQHLQQQQQQQKQQQQQQQQQQQIQQQELQQQQQINYQKDVHQLSSENQQELNREPKLYNSVGRVESFLVDKNAQTQTNQESGNNITDNFSPLGVITKSTNQSVQDGNSNVTNTIKSQGQGIETMIQKNQNQNIVEQKNQKIMPSAFKYLPQNADQVAGNKQITTATSANHLSAMKYTQQASNLTPQSTPVSTPRGMKDLSASPDTLSETDSMKSFRSRRRLPDLPANQEAAPIPNAKKRDRMLKAMMDKVRSFSSIRNVAQSENMNLGSMSTMNWQLKFGNRERPSMSETNLLKYQPKRDCASTIRPESALGLLQGSSLVSSTGEPTPRPYGYPKYSTETDSELAACLPPDLRHLLSATSQTQSQLASCTNAMSTLGLYKKPYEGYLADRMQSSRQATLFGEDDHRSRALGDRSAYDIYRSTNNMPDMDRRYNYQRSTTSGRLRAPRSAYAKHLSDMCVYGDGQDLDVGYRNDYTLRPRSRSYESGAAEDPSRRHWDSSYSSSVYGGNPGALRETAINSVLDHERRRMHPDHRRWDMRRFSDGSDSRPLDYMKYRRSRSWDPSPYSSEDEEEELQREEKKARIKAEIARRRRQIEENVRLHEELLRLARIRENAEHEYSPLSGR